MDIPESAARQLVGPAADVYLARWRRVGERRWMLGFSWVALLFGPYWMLYRRMYRTCGIWLGAVLLWSLAEQVVLAMLELSEPPALLTHGVSVGLGLTCGLFGSYWYYLETRRRFLRLSASGTPTPEALERAGGVSKRDAWIGVLITLVLALLYLLGMAATLQERERPSFTPAPVVTLRGESRRLMIELHDDALRMPRAGPLGLGRS